MKKKNSPMAQMTQDASFGPVFVVGTLPEPQCRVFRRFQSIYTIKHKFSIEKKKKLTKWPKQHRTRRLGPILSTLPFISLPVLSKH